MWPEMPVRFVHRKKEMFALSLWPVALLLKLMFGSVTRLSSKMSICLCNELFSVKWNFHSGSLDLFRTKRFRFAFYQRFFLSPSKVRLDSGKKSCWKFEICICTVCMHFWFKECMYTSIFWQLRVKFIRFVCESHLCMCVEWINLKSVNVPGMHKQASMENSCNFFLSCSSLSSSNNKTEKKLTCSQNGWSPNVKRMQNAHVHELWFISLNWLLNEAKLFRGVIIISRIDTKSFCLFIIICVRCASLFLASFQSF